MQRQTSEATWVNVSVFESIGGPSAISSADGTAVYEQIADALRRGDAAVLSFARVKDVTTAFLNAAIGRLYGDFDEELIREKLRVEHVEADQLVLLDGVIDRARDFFGNPEGYHAAVSEALNE